METRIRGETASISALGRQDCITTANGSSCWSELGADLMASSRMVISDGVLLLIMFLLSKVYLHKATFVPTFLRGKLQKVSNEYKPIVMNNLGYRPNSITYAETFGGAQGYNIVSTFV